MDLLYGLGLALLVLIYFAFRAIRKRWFLHKYKNCPNCGNSLNKEIETYHFKKVSMAGKTHYGDFTQNIIVMKCPYCNFEKCFDKRPQKQESTPIKKIIYWILFAALLIGYFIYYFTHT